MIASLPVAVLSLFKGLAACKGLPTPWLQARKHLRLLFPVQSAEVKGHIPRRALASHRSSLRYRNRIIMIVSISGKFLLKKALIYVKYEYIRRRSWRWLHQFQEPPLAHQQGFAGRADRPLPKRRERRLRRALLRPPYRTLDLLQGDGEPRYSLRSVSSRSGGTRSPTVTDRVYGGVRFRFSIDWRSALKNGMSANWSGRILSQATPSGCG
jgi:hypothetical protein